MRVRIRAMARLTGIREPTLRAWERRYGFPRPMRSEGNNYRVYSREEVDAVRRVARLVQLDGLSVSEAIAMVVSASRDMPPGAERLQECFWPAALLMDSDEMTRVLETARQALDVDTYCDGLLLPLLREMGSRLDIAREHVASALVRHRLWQVLSSVESHALGPRALLACPPGDFHEGGLLGLGVQLKRKGWRVTMMGADTPADALRAACEQLSPDMVALSFVQERERTEFQSLLEGALRACSPMPVVVGGPGAREHLMTTFNLGARYAESAQELIALWNQARSAQNRS
ncbi:MerR family transcriptional regulator [Myxococcus stipitatus]|uniref:MerR family transcriptional regulator n=1 Tax=Myxococcus stipitatus TaxID=83455 RepID=UPI0030CC0DB3